MNHRAKIAISEPCHENWDDMTASEKGKFCSSCQKHVYDFTKSSDREILRKFDSEKNICGRFNNSQLNRDLVVPKKKPAIWIAAAAGVLAIISGGESVNAQPKTEKVSQVNKPSQSKGLKKTISGVVSDQIGVLPGATVCVKYGALKTKTDTDGKFTLLVDESDTLVFSYLGYRDTEIPIAIGKNHYPIVLDNTAINVEAYWITKGRARTIVGAVTVSSETIIKKHRHTFVGRILCDIANLFKSIENKHK